MPLISLRLIAFFLVLASAFPAARAQPVSDSGVLLDRIVAVVDDGVVLKSELEQQVEMISDRLREQGTRMPPEAVLREQILENLVIQQVQLQRAERIGVQISDEQLNMALQRLAERNGITFAELPETLAADGVDYVSFRQQLRREMTLEAVRQRDVMARIDVSESEIVRWLDQYQATLGEQVDYDISQILIALPVDPTQQQIDATRARAEDVYARLQAGADFAELAVAESAGQQALTGGRLGWRRGSQLPAQFATVILALGEGESSEPVRSSSGFHIFRVNATRGGDDKTLELQTSARHILMTPNEVIDDATIRARLEAIRLRVQEGESFEDIARLESEDPGSAARGGDLGWNPPGTFVEEFEAMLSGMQPGDLSEPFRSPFGWHIIQLEDRQERDTTDENRRRQAIQAIRTSKLEQETELWLRKLRDEAWVQILGS